KVVEKFVMQLEAQLADRNVTIELAEESSKWLIEHGYDEQMGARPMARVIQEYIKKPLADDVLFGRLKTGGHVRVIVKKDEAGRGKPRLSKTGGTGAPDEGKTPKTPEKTAKPAAGPPQTPPPRPQTRTP